MLPCTAITLSTQELWEVQLLCSGYACHVMLRSINAYGEVMQNLTISLR